MKAIFHGSMILILIIILTLLSIGFGYLAHNEIENLVSGIQGRYADTPEECSDLDLVDTSYCLRNYIKDFYKYKRTNDILKLSLEELKIEGGDCKNWAEFYYDQAKELGFYVTSPTIKMEGRYAHTFTVISDETGYCILDQLNVDCTKIVL